MRIRATYWIAIILGLLSGCTTTSPEIKQDRAAAARLKLGLTYLAQSHTQADYLDLAYQNLQIAEKHAPNHPYVIFGLAQFHQTVGNVDQAEALYLRLAKEMQDKGVFLIYYGRFLCQQRRYHEAQEYFDKVTRLNNYQWQVDALEQSAYCALFEPDLVKAKTQFKRLFLLAPAKREETAKRVSYYKKRGHITEAQHLGHMIKQT